MAVRDAVRDRDIFVIADDVYRQLCYEGEYHSFAEFRDLTLPRIAKAGYNTVQLMAIPGHPYYGSFGYHVANFFAVAGRFGTPDDFKQKLVQWVDSQTSGKDKSKIRIVIK